MSCYGCIFKGIYEDMGASCDACKLQDYLPDAIKACDNSENCPHRVTLEEAKKKLLSSDVVEVVRCKDCKCGNLLIQDGQEIVSCTNEAPPFADYFCPPMRLDDFCSYGERKEQ